MEAWKIRFSQEELRQLGRQSNTGYNFSCLAKYGAWGTVGPLEFGETDGFHGMGEDDQGHHKAKVETDCLVALNMIDGPYRDQSRYSMLADQIQMLLREGIMFF